jgi:hypothetical protein
VNIFSAVFVYKRPVVLRHCLASVFANNLQPDRLCLIDNASGPETERVYTEACQNRKNTTAQLDIITKPVNLGATDSGRIALQKARTTNPRHFFLIEADYIFRPWAFETAVDVFENTPQGRMALGISGYDHPFFYNREVRERVFPRCMVEQVGEDNVNRAVLYRPFYSGRYVLELVSNTCPTCYLNWHRVQEVAAEFPELNRMLDEVMDPQENPSYPTSGEYGRKKYIDDGMLSHAISLCWNRWAIKHNIDRSRFGAWLNVKPSIANNITGGGAHTELSEMETDGGSPSWTE